MLFQSLGVFEDLRIEDLDSRLIIEAFEPKVIEQNWTIPEVLSCWFEKRLLLLLFQYFATAVTHYRSPVVLANSWIRFRFSGLDPNFGCSNDKWRFIPASTV